MAQLHFSMNVSLDGYVDHTEFAPGPELFAYFTDQVGRLAGSLYGRRIYEIMRYWDDDRAEWGAAERAFAGAWRRQHKWVVSRSLATVGPNASLVTGDLDRAVRRLKSDVAGEIDVAGPTLAHSLAALGLIDVYRLYLHPVVLGSGRPYFAGALPRLRLAGCEEMGEDVVRLSYVPG